MAEETKKTYLRGLGEELVGLAGSAVASNVRAEVATNLGPSIPVYSPAPAGQTGLLEALGVKAALVIKHRDGETIATYGGAPPAFDPVVAGAWLVGVTVVGLAAAKLIRRL